MQVVYEFSLCFLVSFVFFVLNAFCCDPSRESDRRYVLLRRRGADKRSNRIEMPRVTLEPLCLAEVGWLKSPPSAWTPAGPRTRMDGLNC